MRILTFLTLCVIQAMNAVGGETDNDTPTFQSESRVVTVDVMVRDRANRQPVDNLTRDAFRMRIDGKERPISYFRHDAEDRRPLAMLIFFNLAPEGGLQKMSHPAALASFKEALAKLAPDDEVAVFASRDWFVGEAKEIRGLSRDRQAAAQAMQDSVRMALATTESQRQADRRVREKSMSTAVQRAIDAARMRPGSQVALIYVSDGMNTLDTIEVESRQELAEQLQAANISFSAINLQMQGSYAAAAAVINPLGRIFGLSITGSGGYFARQSGGVAVEVPAAGEFGATLEQVVSAYASRYSLGYQLSEREYRDVRKYKIEVKLRGPFKKNREVLSRQSFVGGQ
jgi:VWFA-related protein